MQENRLFDKKELKSLFIGALVLGFIFSFREWGYGTINYSIGLTNLIRYFLLSLIVLLTYQSSHKIMAKKYGASSTFRLWDLKRYWFTKNSKIENISFFGKKFKTITMGTIFPILLAFISNGFFKFAAVGSSEVTSISSRRLGKRFNQISEYEIAQIHLVGPLTCLLLALILNNFEGFDKIVEISYMLAILAMVPFSGLDGGKIVFGSLGLYIFGTTLIVLSVILMSLVNPILSLIASVIVAVTLLILFLYRTI